MSACNANDMTKGCANDPAEPSIDYKNHWNAAYSKGSDEKLGWYETDLSPSLKLVSEANVESDSRILNVGAGSTTLIDTLLELGYNNLIATDISDIALNHLKERVGNERVEYIADDLTKPSELLGIEPVDVWIDRAVLHFFLEEEDRKAYFDLLKEKVRRNGFVILAQFSMNGAKKCSGLPVYNYNVDRMENGLGEEFELVDTFDYTYIQPSGSERPYVYALFKRKA